MTNKRSSIWRYKIILIRLDPSRVFLLVPLLGRPRFYFGFFGTEDLVINGWESRSKEVAINFSGYSL